MRSGLRWEFYRAFAFPWYARIPWLGPRLRNWVNLGLIEERELRQPWRFAARLWRKPVAMRWEGSFGYYEAAPTIRVWRKTDA